MPDQKISVDPAAADLSGCIIPVVTGGINKQAANSLFGITGVANGVIYSAGNRNTSDPTNFNYVPGTQTLTVVGPIRTSPVTNESTVATPANGMIIYSTALSKFRAYENGAWVNLIGGSGGMTNPMTSIGDLIQGDVAGAPVRLASIAAGNVLITGGVTTASSWGKVTNAHVDSTVAITTSGQTFTGVNIFTSPQIQTSITTSSATLNIFTANVSTVTMLSAVTTFTMSGTSQAAVTATFFSNATNSGVTKTINIGTNGLSGSITNINLGSANAGALGTLTLNSTTINGKFIAITATGAFTFAQSAQASGWTPIFTINPGAHTSMTAATEFKDYNFGTRTVTWLAGTTATQRFAHFQGQTVAGASASATFTDLYTVYIDPSIQGSQAIITNNWALGLGGNLQVRLDQNAGTYQVITNATSGASAYSGIYVSTASSLTNYVGLISYSAGVGSSGITGPATSVLVASMTNGLNIGTNNSTQLSLWTNNIKRQGIDANGLFTFIQSTQAVSNTFITFTQAIHTGGTPTGLLYTQGAHTGLILSVESLAINLNTSATVQYATGAQTILRNILVQAPTIAFVGASTITDNATFTISGAPKAGTNTTQTNTHGLLIQAGAVTSAGSAFGLTVNAPTGGTSNYTAQFLGGQVNFIYNSNTASAISIQNQQTAGQGVITFLNDVGTNSNAISSTNSTFITSGIIVAGQLVLDSKLSGGIALLTEAAADIVFATNGASNERFRIAASGAVSMVAKQVAAPATTGTMTTTLTNLSAITITPTGACTFNASGGISGQRCAFVITTSGVTSFVLTWGTNYKTTGTLATGTVTAKVFTVEFVYDGTNWNEVARTVAM